MTAPWIVDHGDNSDSADAGDDAATSTDDSTDADTSTDDSTDTNRDTDTDDSIDDSTDADSGVVNDSTSDTVPAETDAPSDSGIDPLEAPVPEPQTSDTADPDAGADTTEPSVSSTSADAPAADPGPPYLIVDQYSGDSGMNPPWSALVARPQFYGAIVKAWEGKTFSDGGWFARNWPAVKDAGGSRYGSSWFRGAYLFLKFDTAGGDQAAAYLQAIDAAGGWDHGDIMPIVDVELGGAGNANHRASAQQVIDCVSACAQKLKSELGSRVMLYGRGAMRDLGITDKMGCDVAWNPSYTQQMVRHGLEAFQLEEIVLWQYCGDNTSYLAGYPHTVPGFTKIDISVFVMGAARPTLDDLRNSVLK